MHRRLAIGSSIIALVVAALLASREGASASPRTEAYAAVSIASPTGDPSVAPTQDTPAERGGLRRTAVLRGSAPAVSRVHAPGGATGRDGPRAAALDAETPLLELVTVRVASLGADVRRRHVPRTEQRAPSSRGPPFA
jgi:hypothetical protein